MEGSGLRDRWVMNRKVIKRSMLKAGLYTLLPLLPPLNHNSTTVVENCLFFFPVPVCGNDAICLHYGDDIISKSSLHLKMHKMIGRTGGQIPSERDWLLPKRQAKCMYDWRQKYAGLWHDRRIAFRRRRSPREKNVESFPFVLLEESPFFSLLFGSASRAAKAVLSTTTVRHFTCMHAYIYVLYSTRLPAFGNFASDPSHPI